MNKKIYVVGGLVLILAILYVLNNIYQKQEKIAAAQIDRDNQLLRAISSSNDIKANEKVRPVIKGFAGHVNNNSENAIDS